MKVGDLVKMDFDDWPNQDEWGPGIILTIEPDVVGGDFDVEVMWSKIGVGWELSTMLDVVNEGR